MLEEAQISCPYCGEALEVIVDRSGGSQEYVEDCSVCCNPIVLSIRLDWNGQLAAIEVRAENR